MFHMLSCFDLAPDENLETFTRSYRIFVEEMQAIDLVVDSSPVGQRQSDTPMDTDGERQHQYFTVMTFRDRGQVDAAYAHIEKHFGPADAAHDQVYSRFANPVFICWQDIPL